MSTDETRAAAENGDVEAMVDVARQLEREAHASLVEANAWYERADFAQSPRAKLARVRRSAMEGLYDDVVWHLDDAVRRFGSSDAPLVSVSPEFEDPWVLAEDPFEDYPGAGVFTVLSPQIDRVAGALARAAPRLMLVDDAGRTYADWDAIDDAQAQGEEVYTPNYLFGVRVSAKAAQVMLDTKSVMTKPMAQMMVNIIAAELATERCAAHIAGACPGLTADWSDWALD